MDDAYSALTTLAVGPAVVMKRIEGTILAAAGIAALPEYVYEWIGLGGGAAVGLTLLAWRKS